MSRERPPSYMLGLELQLYVADKHPELTSVDVAMAFLWAFVEQIAAYAKGEDTPDRLCDDRFVTELRRMIAARLANPQPFRPEEILAMYRAERAGKPWKH